MLRNGCYLESHHASGASTPSGPCTSPAQAGPQARIRQMPQFQHLDRTSPWPGGHQSRHLFHHQRTIYASCSPHPASLRFGKQKRLTQHRRAQTAESTFDHPRKLTADWEMPAAILKIGPHHTGHYTVPPHSSTTSHLLRFPSESKRRLSRHRRSSDR